MSDKVCDICGVPKPDICFDHTRAHEGVHKGTCSSCVSGLLRNSKKRYASSAKGKSAVRRAKDRLRQRDPKKWARQYAEAIEGK